MKLVNKVQMSPQGPAFSRLVQGYWRMGEWGMNQQQRLTFLKQHIELGITTVDHAHVYGNPSCESLFGEALRLEPSIRDGIEIVSKCGINLLGASAEKGQVVHYNFGKKSILDSVDTSLERLGVEHLDALLLHRPDFLMDADEVAEAFTQLKQSGKVVHFGVSNFNASQFSLIQSRLSDPLITNQVEINPLNFDVVSDGTLDQLQQLRIRPMAWSFLAGGRIFSEQSEQMTRLRSTLTELATELCAESIDQVVLAWVLRLASRPLVIVGSGKIERVRSAVQGLELSMDHEQWYRLWVASKGHGIP